MIQTPYDVQARFSRKRQTTWTGYKVHLTESCDPDLPLLLTDVQTTSATEPDHQALPKIQTALHKKQLTPRTHLVDAGYVDADNLVTSEQRNIDLVGPAPRDTSWQARSELAFDLPCFHIDWQAQQLTCPAGNKSRVWSQHTGPYGNIVIDVRFQKQDCLPCSHRTLCTRADTGPRCLKLRARPQHEALQVARSRQQTPQFKQTYQARAGVEGTISYATCSFKLRRCRYIGLAKAHLQNIFTACAINLTRIARFWQQKPKSKTRLSAFASLAAL